MARNCGQCSLTVGNPEFFRGITTDLTTETHLHDNYLINDPQGVLVRMNSWGSYYNCNYFNGGNVGFNFDLATIDPQGGPANTTDNQWVNYDLTGSMKIDGRLDPPIAVDWYFDLSQGAASSPNPYDPNPYNPFVVFFNSGSTALLCTQEPPVYDIQNSLLRLVNDSSYLSELAEKKSIDWKKAYEFLSDSIQYLTLGTTADVPLQNFFNAMNLSNYGYLKNVQELLLNNELLDAALANLSIVPSNLHEANSKLVNEVLAASDFDSLRYDSAQAVALRNIAYMNPIVGGEAVYRARAILRLDLEDLPIGFRQSQSTVLPAPKDGNPDFSVFPNPTTGKLTIRTAKPSVAGHRLVLHTLYGTQVHIETVLRDEQTTCTVDVSALPPGVYQLSIEEALSIYRKQIVLIR